MTLKQRHNCNIASTFICNHYSTLFKRWKMTLIQRHNCHVASTFTCNQNSPLFKLWKMTLKQRNNFNVASTFICDQNSTLFKRSSMTLKQRWLNLKMPAGITTYFDWAMARREEINFSILHIILGFLCFKKLREGNFWSSDGMVIFQNFHCQIKET